MEKFDQEVFLIRKIEFDLPIQASELPLSSYPLGGFLFLVEGEVVATVGDTPYLCRGGQFLLIPENTPFSVQYYDVTGYSGMFSLPFLRDVSYPCLTSGTPLLHTFWFDEAAFVGALMERMALAQSRQDPEYIRRAMDLLLYSIQTPTDEQSNPLVSRFMDLIFDRSAQPDTVAGYAARLCVSPSYLNKQVRNQTRHSAMEWVEIARMNWAKTLLKDRSLSVREVASAVGLDDASYFTRFFRKVTRMTPSEYRRKLGGVQEFSLKGMLL